MAIAEQERDRAKVEAQYTWNLEDVYPDQTTWRQEKDRLKAAIPRVGTFAARLGESPARHTSAGTRCGF